MNADDNPQDEIGRARTEQILGLRFFQGTPAQAVQQALTQRGLIVAPSATCFTRLREDEEYRRAMLAADIVLPDSGAMALLWRLLQRRSTARVSGLAYLKELLHSAALSAAGDVLWVLPNEAAAAKFRAWVLGRGSTVEAEALYVAPMYGRTVTDETLLERVRSRKPQHIVIAISGGVQEKLGFWLRERAGYRPAIHCIGGALGFVTGDQVKIPKLADSLYLGWLFRLATNPRRFLPRARQALLLPSLIARYGRDLPPMKY